MGREFLLVLAVHYDDGFHGRRGGFLVTTLGITGFSFSQVRIASSGNNWRRY
ncbi:MAG: hypothetical protein IMZ43_01125 [Thermoplasmata archaeon]|nr:hypothetical protein [Thermoplasmata archaeon]